MKVDSALNPLIFDKVEHKQINNLVLVDSNGKSHQIDHVEIRANGIFCIETKNYAGRIYGSENQEKWTQVLSNGTKNQLVNPLKQNKSHVYHISKALENKYKINSVVVMVNNNAASLLIPNVVDLNDLRTYLNVFDDGTRYSVEEMENIYQKLKTSAVKMSNLEHVSNVKQTQKEIQNGICPRCGGKLIYRNGKYGPFQGCSNYPSCKFVLKEN